MIYLLFISFSHTIECCFFFSFSFVIYGVLSLRYISKHEFCTVFFPLLKCLWMQQNVENDFNISNYFILLKFLMFLSFSFNSFRIFFCFCVLVRNVYFTLTQYHSVVFVHLHLIWQLNLFVLFCLFFGDDCEVYFYYLRSKRIVSVVKIKTHHPFQTNPHFVCLCAYSL